MNRTQRTVAPKLRSKHPSRVKHNAKRSIATQAHLRSRQNGLKSTTSKHTTAHKQQRRNNTNFMESDIDIISQFTPDQTEVC